ncbi:MAG TPA: hypothetical protein VMJ32_00895 [Pirellulales bacterium]|nr:hypothetical protein [Pirellulales bacterium]
MNQSNSTRTLTLPNLALLRELLNALASFRDLSDPFTSPSQLQSALELLLNLATTLGLDPKWFTWLQAIQNNPQLLNLVLAVGQYLESFIEPTPSPTPASVCRQSSSRAPTALAIDWDTWLSLLTELVQLLHQLWPTQ